MTEARMSPHRHPKNIDNFRRNNVKPLGVVMQTTAQEKTKSGVVLQVTSEIRHARRSNLTTRIIAPRFESVSIVVDLLP
jgi:hypothetical protein